MRNENNPVSKAIAYFNMLADWTATIILVQAKRSRRVNLIEHLIGLATELRKLNNYDCLSKLSKGSADYVMLIPSEVAVLVGLNSQPVYRLNELKRASDNDITKRVKLDALAKKLKSLNTLMSNTRSFASYRLAISDPQPDMIPYL